MRLRITLSLITVLGLWHTAQAFDFGSAMKSVSATQEPQAQSTAETSLLGSLSSQLGITQTQAAGGTSAILNDASKNMSTAEKSQLTGAVPALSSLMGGSGTSASSGMLGSIMNNATVNDQFKSMGLDPAMVQQFIPIILNYVQSEGGSDMMNLLKNAL